VHYRFHSGKEDNVKTDLKEMGYVHWTRVAQDRVQWRALVNTGINRRVTQKAVNFLSI
jgi:hypothetical protein